MPHRGVQKWLADLNHLYRSEPALYQMDTQPAGFEWIDCHDAERSILSFARKAANPDQRPIMVVCNFTPVPRHGYRLGALLPGFWKEALNSDAAIYGGSGIGNLGGVSTTATSAHGRPQSLLLTLPPLSAVFLRHE
jgi:1,4-alpha-glucan branching enzyme